MACAGCDFNLPKASARAQALESRLSIGRYLEAVPLTPDERAIAEGDLEKLDSLIHKLDNVPTWTAGHQAKLGLRTRMVEVRFTLMRNCTYLTNHWHRT